MRVQVGHALRARHGDVVAVSATLTRGSNLGRLFVFAKERENDTFSPYVPDLATKMTAVGEMQPMQPMMFRVTDQRPTARIEFVSDIDGKFALMQEIDTKTDPRVAVQWKRQVNPALPAWCRFPLQVGAWLIPSLI